MAPAFFERVRARYGRKAMRYSAVSVVGVSVTEAVLLFCHAVLDWSATASNVTAVCVASLPAYLLNRAWVWGKRGSHRFTREVLPFWGMALLGLLFSTALVAIADDWSSSSLVVVGANVTAFGTLWVAKFFLLDGVLFGGRPAAVEEPAADAA